jgi:hypothetical protein
MKITLLNIDNVAALEVSSVDAPVATPTGEINTENAQLYPIPAVVKNVKLTLLTTGKDVILTREEAKNLVAVINNGIV